MGEQPRHSHFEPVTRAVVKVLARRGVKAAPSHHDDLRESGMSSLDMVNLMLAVECECGIVIPTAVMTPQNFRTIATIEALVASLHAVPQAPDEIAPAATWAPSHA